jgi:hypothetical protein
MYFSSPYHTADLSPQFDIRLNIFSINVKWRGKEAYCGIIRVYFENWSRILVEDIFFRRIS